ncbi:helix-turn-helix domain-containing protein [Nocardia sp. R16R-3T]
MTVPEVQRFGPAVVLTGAAVPNVRRCLIAAAKALRRDGIAAPPWLLVLIAELAAAAAEVGHADRETGVPQASSMTTTTIGSKEVAEMLGCSTRQVRRLARTLEARRVGKTWTFDPDVVRAYQLGRSTENG